MATEPKVIRRAVLPALIAICLCLPTGFGEAFAQTLGEDWPSNPEDVSLVVLTPRIKLYQVDDRGAMALREDWSATARERVSDALKAFLANSSATIAWESASAVSPEQRRLTEDLKAVHAAVGAAMTGHFGGGGVLQTKRQDPQWTLGEGTEPLGQAHGVDYALFIQINDSHATGERITGAVAQQLIVGFGMEKAFLRRIGFASLVHLATGRVVWFGHQISTIGSLRREKDTRDILDDLFAGFPAQ